MESDRSDVWDMYVRLATVVVWGLFFGANATSAQEKPLQQPLTTEVRSRQFSADLDGVVLRGTQAKRAAEILSKPLIHRTMAEQRVPCNPQLFLWLSRHPHWVAQLWRELGLDVAPIEQTSVGFICRENEHTRVHFEVLSDEDTLRVLYCRGETCRPPLPFKLEAELVIVHRYRFEQDEQNRWMLIHSLEGFASARGLTLQLALRVARQTSEQIVDRCLDELQLFFGIMTRLVELRPTWALVSLDSIRPKFPGDEFLQIRELVLATVTANREPSRQPTDTALPPDVAVGMAAAPLEQKWSHQLSKTAAKPVATDATPPVTPGR